MYYSRNPNAKDQEASADKLGRCCFTCVHRGEREGHMLLCTMFDKKVWDKAQCRRWVLTKDIERLSQFKKYMRLAKSESNKTVSPE